MVQPRAAPKAQITTRLRRALLLLCVFAGLWAAVVALTGGLAVHVGEMRLSSRSPWISTIIGALSALAAWALATPGERRQVLKADWSSGAAPATAALVAAAIVAIGLLKGAFVAGGSDSYGYVSQAHLWATGSLRIEQPFMSQLTWPYAFQAMAPLGYRPAPYGTSIVPVYSPGLPMAMAVFERLGGRDAVFLVVPLFGGLAVWATYLMGTRLAGKAVGLSAAILLATSPAFLNQLLNPMSDVPVTAWWASALALLLAPETSGARMDRWTSLAAGLAVGAAILTRPNLAPLAAIPGLFLLWQAARERSMAGPAAQRVLLFAAGVIPACSVIAILNHLWYGSPLSSGYGSLTDLYGWQNLRPNLARYPTWLFETQTPVVLLALAAPFFAAPLVTVTWLVFIAAVFGCYLFYFPFDSVWYLRFLLPAFPPLLVLTSVGITGIVARLMRRARGVTTAAIVLLLAWHNLHYTLDRSMFGFRDSERKYVAVGNYISKKLPERAVLFSMQHSGSARYYSGRLTARFDMIPPTRLDWAIMELRGLGYHPYFLLERWEEDEFRTRFKDHSQLAALDWPPVARLQDSSDVKIYDPADKDDWRTRPQVATDVIY
jgi:hypothetical protein